MAVLDRPNALGGGSITDLTEGTFDAFVASSRLVFVDFWAGWCRPCRAMAPIVRRLSRQYGGDVAFGKVDTEAEKALATRFSVRSIPTYVLFKRGADRGAVLRRHVPGLPRAEDREVVMTA